MQAHSHAMYTTLFPDLGCHNIILGFTLIFEMDEETFICCSKNLKREVANQILELKNEFQKTSNQIDAEFLKLINNYSNNFLDMKVSEFLTLYDGNYSIFLEKTTNLTSDIEADSYKKPSISALPEKGRSLRNRKYQEKSTPVSKKKNLGKKKILASSEKEENCSELRQPVLSTPTANEKNDTTVKQPREIRSSEVGIYSKNGTPLINKNKKDESSMYFDVPINDNGKYELVKMVNPNKLCNFKDHPQFDQIEKFFKQFHFKP
ncbi:hypothetical protein HDU92_002093 [Lobulomyces angularis]|nr:hypothetical protein HDU92_002093 [Lobulomyces angularis]